MTHTFRPTPDLSRDLRSAFGRFATGVTVVTTRTAEGPVGMTANSFSSVSLDPAMALWAIARSSDRFAIFAAAERYAIHILAEDQSAVSTGFARGPDFFASTPWRDGTDGIPVLDGVLARFDCRLSAVHDGGDHVILVGEILEVSHREGAPLLFAGGRYARLGPAPD